MTKHHIRPHESLEALIDRHGLSAVLSAIEDICDAKANHVASAWCDIGLAKAWALAAHRIEAAHVPDLGL